MAQAPMVARKPLDLNTASAEELVALIGISEMIAESIVDFAMRTAASTASRNFWKSRASTRVGTSASGSW
jgi:hypothetical protein